MGLSFVILFWLIVLGGIAGVAIVSFAIYRKGQRVNSRVWRFIGAFGTLVPVLLLTLVGGTFVYSMWSLSHPPKVFELLLGSAPSSDILDLKSDVFTFADQGSFFLSFRANETAFKKLLPEDVNPIDDKASAKIFELDRDVKPAWWFTQPSNRMALYCNQRYTFYTDRPRTKRKVHWSSESFCIAYDACDSDVYVRLTGVD